MKREINKLARFVSLLEKHFGLPPRNSNDVTPLTVLIGTILSQNTNDKNSFRAYEGLIKKYGSWESISGLSASQIKEEIKIAGLAEQKSQAIKTVLTMVFSERTLDLEAGSIKKMNDIEIIKKLLSVNGVGIKTAACVLLFGLKRNVCPVDTHVHRVLNRTGVVSTSTPDKTYTAIQPMLPARKAHSLHTNLIRLGRSICQPAKPKCGICPLRRACNFTEKNLEINVKFVKQDFMLLDSL